MSLYIEYVFLKWIFPSQTSKETVKLGIKKSVVLFGPKWLLYYTHLHGYNNVMVISNNY